jgi:hypothetical protein
MNAKSCRFFLEFLAKDRGFLICLKLLQSCSIFSWCCNACNFMQILSHLARCFHLVECSKQSKAISVNSYYCFFLQTFSGSRRPRSNRKEQQKETRSGGILHSFLDVENIKHLTAWISKWPFYMTNSCLFMHIVDQGWRRSLQSKGHGGLRQRREPILCHC